MVLSNAYVGTIFNLLFYIIKNYNFRILIDAISFTINKNQKAASGYQSACCLVLLFVNFGRAISIQHNGHTSTITTFIPGIHDVGFIVYEDGCVGNVMNRFWCIGGIIIGTTAGTQNNH